MAERRCTFKCGDWNCGSYQFNLYKDGIDQGDLCDVHYWQTKAQRKWVGLTDEDERVIVEKCQGINVLLAISLTKTKLKEKNT